MKKPTPASNATSRRKLELTIKARSAARQAELARDRAKQSRKTMKAARKSCKQAKKAAKRAAKKSKQLAKELQAFLNSTARASKAGAKPPLRARRPARFIPPNPLDVLAVAPPPAPAQRPSPAMPAPEV